MLHLESFKINFSHKPLLAIPEAIDGQTFMSIRCDVEMLSVGGKLAVVRDIFRGSNSHAVGGDVLDDVRPVYGNGDEVRPNLQYVVGCVTDAVAVFLFKPLVRYNHSIFEIADTRIVRLPVTFIEDNQAFLPSAE